MKSKNPSNSTFSRPSAGFDTSDKSHRSLNQLFRVISGHFVVPFRALSRFFTLDRLALLVSLLGIVVSYLVADRVFDRMPHIEDEVAYVWQARVIAHGQLTIPTPPHPKSYLVPFVVDLDGQRFGKYPLGWPALLALAVGLGLRSWMNPLLAGLGVWLTYRLGKRFFSPVVGMLTAGLTVTSPFFLMNSGSLLSHPFGLVLSAAFVLAWLDLFDPQRSLPPYVLVLAAGLSLGMLVLTRPFTALAVAIPFGLHGLYLLIRGSWAVRRRVLAVGLIVLGLSGLYFGWQAAVTGDPLKNPYLLWWPYDKIGFGIGYGVLKQGHNLPQALYNTGQSLRAGFYDLFGWGALSWIFIPIGLWAVTFGRMNSSQRSGVPRKSRAGIIPALVNFSAVNWQAWMMVGVFASLVIVYMAYWIGSELFGPRYYYEGLFCLTLLSGAGIAYLAGWPVHDAQKTSDDAQITSGDAQKTSGVHSMSGDSADGLNRRPAWVGKNVGMDKHAGVGKNVGVDKHVGVGKNVGVDKHAGVGNHVGVDKHPGVGNHVGVDKHAGVGNHVGLPLRAVSLKNRTMVMGLIVAGLVAYNLVVYLPDRLAGMHGLYGIRREILQELPAPLPPALIIVHSKTWHFYGALLELEDPFLTSPYIFAWSMDPTLDAALQNDFPNRAVYHYYEDHPGVLYTRPRDDG